MGYGDDIEIDSLVGEVLTHIDTDEENNEIMLTTQSGRIIKIYHRQDCCESVDIAGLDGDWQQLVGKVIIEATHDEVESDVEYGSKTDTTLKFRVNDATVISRWIGESNGYYSESVDLEDVTKKSQ